MKLRNIFGVAAIAALATVGLASCGPTNTKNQTTTTGGSNNGGDNGGGSTDTSTDSKTITFYTTAGDLPMTTLNQAKAKFEAENEGWKVSIVNGFDYPKLRTKLTAMISSNTQPSLAYCYPDHVSSYMKSGKVLNLDSFINNTTYGYTTEEWNDFIPTYMTEGTSYGVEGTYSIPMARSTEVLYYNKDILDQYSLSVPKTWDEVWEVCAKLKKYYPKSKPLAYDSDDNWAITYLEQYAALNGGKYYTDGTKKGKEKILFNNDVTKQFLTTLKSKYDAGLFTTKGICGSYSSTLFKDDYATKIQNKATFDGCFLAIGSTGGAAKQDPAGAFKVGIAGVPGITEASAKQISQGPSICMFDQGNSELAVATWKFVKVLLSPEIQAKYSIDNGYNPVRASVYDREDFIEAMEDGSLVNKTILLSQELGAKNVFYCSDSFVGSSEARDAIGSCVTNVMLSNASELEDYLEEAYEEAAYKAKQG